MPDHCRARPPDYVMWHTLVESHLKQRPFDVNYRRGLMAQTDDLWDRAGAAMEESERLKRDRDRILEVMTDTATHRIILAREFARRVEAADAQAALSTSFRKGASIGQATSSVDPHDAAPSTAAAD